MFERLTWRPKIRQRQWFKKQRLYGYRGGPAEPDQEISEDEDDASQDEAWERLHNPE